MTKAELIESIADSQEMSRRQVGEIIDMILEEITKDLQRGQKVALTPFGSFVVRARKKREGRNPKTGEKITIAARKVPAFQAGKALKDAIGGVKAGSSSKKSSAKKSAAKKSPAKKSAAKKGGRKR